MKLAAQLYTVRDYTKNPQDIYETLKKIKNIGYDIIQVSAFGPIKPMLLKSYIDEIGLDICVTHSAFDRILNDTEKLIEEHKLWNCEYIGLGAMPGEYRNAEGYKNFSDIMQKPVEIIKNAGLKFVYHNHRFEFENIGGGTGMDFLAKSFDKDSFGFLVDTFWVQAGGASPSQFITKYSDYIDIIHLKDMTVVDDQITMAEVGEGNMDFIAIGEACKKANVKFAAVEQDVCVNDPFVCLKTSFDNVKKLSICEKL